MKTRQRTVLSLLVLLGAAPAFPQAKNGILFIADGLGLPSVNAASIYGYGKPQALYVQSMPHVALADASNTREWIPDGPSNATAWATGVKVHNGLTSMSDDTERGGHQGEPLKTMIEYAEERGLSTGLITDVVPAGIADPFISAAYAHLSGPPRRLSGDTFMQLLEMKYGNGPDVVIGTGREIITAQLAKDGKDIAVEIAKHGYTYVDSVAAVTKLDPTRQRVIALFDGGDFDLSEAVHQAAARLSQNPKGFLLVVVSDCHMSGAERDLQAVVRYDKAIRRTAEDRKKDTLVMFAGNFSIDLHLIGENLNETLKSADNKKIVDAIYNEGRHTAEETPVMAMGPGSERVKGYMPNTDIFNVMMSGLDLRP